MAEIRLMDLHGRMLLTRQVQGREVRKALQNGFPNLYLLKVLFRDGNVGIRRIVGF
jgi:hypothetical protein